jgi:hypothetical protein
MQAVLVFGTGSNRSPTLEVPSANASLDEKSFPGVSLRLAHHWLEESNESRDHAAVVVTFDDRCIDRRGLQERAARSQSDHACTA